VNSKASILRLTGLSHGTYSIRLTVTDAAGLKNSTMAAVNVEEVSTTSLVTLDFSISCSGCNIVD